MRSSFPSGSPQPDAPAHTIDGHFALPPFRHEALLYSGREDFVRKVGAFVRDGAGRGEPTLVMVGAEKIEALRSELGDDARAVRFEDMERVGRNPARIIPAWRDFAREHGGGGRALRGVGEPIWAGRDAQELVECQRHEVLLNLAFEEAAGFHLVCPYDTAALGDEVISEAARSHPCLAHGQTIQPSAAYDGLERACEPFDEPLPEPPAGAAELRFGRGGLPAVRAFVGRRAGAADLDGPGYDLVLAVNELASNSLRHGGGAGKLRVWRSAGALVCEVSDAGRIEDPLAGRGRPETPRAGGLGLWIVNQLCDLVQLRAFPDGNVVRVHMRAA